MYTAVTPVGGLGGSVSCIDNMPFPCGIGVVEVAVLVEVIVEVVVEVVTGEVNVVV